jgi:hypothetical protein
MMPTQYFKQQNSEGFSTEFWLLTTLAFALQTWEILPGFVRETKL